MRIDGELRDAIAAYGERYGLSIAEVARLALLSQIDREPRGKGRPGVSRPQGNPRIAEHSADALAARWGDGDKR